MEKRLFTSECVTCGHPDKVADAISDAVLDACLSQDPNSRVACEVMVTTDFCVICGEISTKAQVDYEAVARKTIDRGTGARGLRSVIEGIMTKIMFEVPSDLSIQKVIITEDCVTSGAEPRVIRSNELRQPVMETLALPAAEH